MEMLENFSPLSDIRVPSVIFSGPIAYAESIGLALDGQQIGLYINPWDDIAFRFDEKLAPRYEALERAAAVATTDAEIEAVEREAEEISAVLRRRKMKAA